MFEVGGCIHFYVAFMCLSVLDAAEERAHPVPSQTPSTHTNDAHLTKQAAAEQLRGYASFLLAVPQPNSKGDWRASSPLLDGGGQEPRVLYWDYREEGEEVDEEGELRVGCRWWSLGREFDVLRLIAFVDRTTREPTPISIEQQPPIHPTQKTHNSLLLLLLPAPPAARLHGRARLDGSRPPGLGGWVGCAALWPLGKWCGYCGCGECRQGREGGRCMHAYRARAVHHSIHPSIHPPTQT